MPVRKYSSFLTRNINDIRSEEELTLYLRENASSEDAIEWVIGTKRGRKYFELLCRLNHDVSNGLVLNIGSGFGGISLFLSQKAKAVVALDVDRDLLSIAHRRAKNAGRNNMFTLLASATNLPIRNDCINLTLMVGVLEWVPYSRPTKNPMETQLEVLREVKRELKKKGILILAIENRLYLGYWLGEKDHHSQLPFVPILPRFLADIICRLLKRERYFFNRTYSYIELRKAFVEEGFEIQKIFLGLPNYSLPQEIIDLNDKVEVDKKSELAEKEISRKIIWKCINKAGLTKFFCNNQIWICHKPSTP